MSEKKKWQIKSGDLVLRVQAQCDIDPDVTKVVFAALDAAAYSGIFRLTLREDAGKNPESGQATAVVKTMGKSSNSLRIAFQAADARASYIGFLSVDDESATRPVPSQIDTAFRDLAGGKMDWFDPEHPTPRTRLAERKPRQINTIAASWHDPAQPPPQPGAVKTKGNVGFSGNIEAITPIFRDLAELANQQGLLPDDAVSQVLSRYLGRSRGNGPMIKAWINKGLLERLGTDQHRLTERAVERLQLTLGRKVDPPIPPAPKSGTDAGQVTGTSQSLTEPVATPSVTPRLTVALAAAEAKDKRLSEIEKELADLALQQQKINERMVALQAEIKDQRLEDARLVIGLLAEQLPLPTPSIPKPS